MNKVLISNNVITNINTDGSVGKSHIEISNIEVSVEKGKKKKKKCRTLPNKYYIMKALKPDYLVLVTTKKNKFGLTSYGVDRILLQYLKNGQLLRTELYEKLNNYRINYLVLDGIEECFVHSFVDNQYGNYLYTALLEYLI